MKDALISRSTLPAVLRCTSRPAGWREWFGVLDNARAGT